MLYYLTLSSYRDVAHCTKKGKTVKTFFFFFLMKRNVVNILMRRPKQIRLWARGDHSRIQRYTKCMRFTKRPRYGRCHRHGGKYRVLTHCNNLSTTYIYCNSKGTSCYCSQLWLNYFSNIIYIITIICRDVHARTKKKTLRT